MNQKISGYFKRFWIIVLIALVFLIYLAFANRIMAYIAGAAFRPLHVSIEQYERNGVRYSIDEAICMNNFYDQVHIGGWALCAGEEIPEKKQIGIILSGEDGKLYEYSAAPNYERADINAIQKNKSVNGFSFMPSTLLLPDGKFEVYLFCNESEDNFGITSTPYMLCKSGATIEVIQQDCIEENWDESVHIADDAEAYLTSEKKANGQFKVTGWIYVPNMPTGLQKVYLCVTNQKGDKKYYRARSVSRGDLASRFGNDFYWSCGFEAEIDNIDLQGCSLSVIAKNNQGCHTAPGMLINLGLWQSERIELDFSEVLDDAMLSIDKITTRKDGLISVKGWAYVPNQDTVTQKVFVRFDYNNGEYDVFTTHTSSRQDIANHFGNDLYNMCGYDAMVPESFLRDKEYKTSIIIVNATGLHTTKAMALDLGLWQSEKVNLEISSIVGDAQLYIDRNEVDRTGFCTVKGWAYVPDQNTEGQTVYIWLDYGEKGHDIFTAQSLSRKDIANHFENDLYQMCGFFSKIPAELLKSKDFSVTILIENESGFHTSEIMLNNLPKTTEEELTA